MLAAAGASAAAAPALMLRALVHQALGTPLAVFAAESREALRGAAAETETVARPRPGRSSCCACWNSAKPGTARPWTARSRTFGAVTPTAPTDHALRTVGTALLAQTRAAAGRAVQGLDAGLPGGFGTPCAGRGVFFFNEFVLGRLVVGYLAVGDWESAERELVDYAAGQPRDAAAFAGSIQVLRGYSLLRQGRIERAYQTLLPAVETLRLNDPLQLFRFGSALAFYVAARLGDAAQSSGSSWTTRIRCRVQPARICSQRPTPRQVRST